MAEVNWTLQAIADVENIAEYISGNSLNYASLFIENVFEKVQPLKAFPKLGRMVPEYENPLVRELIFSRKYRIIYKIVSDERVDIITVHHHSQLLPPSI